MPGIKKRYKASTLIEVLVAMIIILICAGLGMSAFSNLNKDMNGNLEIRAEVYLDKVANNAKAGKNYTDEVFQFEGIRIEKSFMPYKKEKRLIVMDILAFNGLNQNIGEIKEVILVTP